MSHPSIQRRARRLALAGATVLTAVAVAPSANAATRTLNFQCKYPLIGTNPVKLAIDAPSPFAAEAGAGAPPVPISAVATLSGNTSPGLTLVEGLTTIDGTLNLGSTLAIPAGPSALPVQVPLTLSPWHQSDPIQDSLVFHAEGDVPSIVIDAVGPADLSLNKFSMNLTARDAAGEPILLPPITKDLDGLRVTDSDNDPATFDVYCKLNAVQPDTDYLTYLVGDGPLPTTPDTVAPSVPGSPSTSDLKPNSVNLSWGASTDDVGGSGLKRYAIRFAGREVRVGSGTSSTLITGLTPNTPYDFSIVAVDRANNESAPAHATVTTPTKPNEPPTQVTGISGTLSGTTVSLTWNASSDDVAVVGYNVYRDGSKVATVPGTSASVTGISNGLHTFTVEAVDGEGSIGFSGQTTLNVGTNPGPGGGLTYRCKYPLLGTNPLTLKLSFDTPSTWPNGQPTAPFGVTALLTLSGNTAAGFTLVEGLSSIEGTVNVRTSVALPGGAPPIVVNVPLTLQPYTVGTPPEDPIMLRASGSMPPLTIDEPGVSRATIGGLAINLKMRDASGGPIVLPPVTKDLDLNPVTDSDGDPQTFDVYCKVDAGQQLSTGGFELTTVGDVSNDVTPPSAPTEATMTAADLTPTSINVRWNASIDNPGGSGVKEYIVRYKDQEFRVPASSLSKLLAGLTGDSEYFVTISAVDFAGNESEALELFFVTPTPPVDVAPPSNPGSIAVVPGATCAALSWAAATDNVGIVGFDVYNGATLVTSVTGTSATICGLTSNTSYTFKVVAKDAAGNKSSGGPVTFKTLPTPPDPTTPIPTTGSITSYGYALAGSATLKTLTKGTLPLKGTIDAKLTLATGAFSADLALAQTQGRLTALGFLPVTAKIGFVPSGKTTGSLLDGVLTTNSKVRIKVQEVKLFGAIPLVGGNNCQSKQLSDINLKSTQAEFSPLDGGSIAGTFKISDLNGCGALNGLVSPLTAGAGNAIALNLTPKR